MPEPQNAAGEKLQEAFRQALGLPADADIQNAAYGVTEGWDSAAHMALIAEIEGAFDIMLDTEEVIGMSSYSVAKETVQKHGVQFGA